MSLDLALLRRRLIDGESVTITDRDPRTDGIRGYILFASEAREIVERLERAEQVAVAARACIANWTTDGTFDHYVGPEQDLRKALEGGR